MWILIFVSVVMDGAYGILQYFYINNSVTMSGQLFEFYQSVGIRTLLPALFLNNRYPFFCPRRKMSFVI